jgi:integrase
LVLLAGSTGLRRGELIALRWRNVDFELRQASVTHSVWRSIEGDAKTEASRRPVPLHTIVIEELKQWRKTTLYNCDDDFLFPSVVKNGKQPLTPDMILRRHIRAALERIGARSESDGILSATPSVRCCGSKVSISKLHRSYYDTPILGSRWNFISRL